VELERREIKARAKDKTDPFGRPKIPEEDVVVGYSVVTVDLDDVKRMFQAAANEMFGQRTVLEDGTVKFEPVDTNKLSTEQKLQVLERMGYTKYFDLLRKEGVFEWL